MAVLVAPMEAQAARVVPAKAAPLASTAPDSTAAAVAAEEAVEPEVPGAMEVPGVPGDKEAAEPEGP